MSSRSSSRERILVAAEEVVLKEGATHMTLDAVAKKAGVSKGGLMYHFPSQRDLLQAMEKRFSDYVEARIAKFRETLPASPVREIKAYILTWFVIGAEYRRAATALLAAVNREPEMLDAVRKKHLKTMARIFEASSNPERAMILALATEGVWMSELLGISTYSDSERRRIKRALLQLANEWLCAPATNAPPKCPRRQRKTHNNISR
ncbi:MAG: TetR/AcrR family transcriptional regulator [Kiritimatiellia bacterium]|jgi:AcrR family transcriptional regulator